MGIHISAVPPSNSIQAGGGSVVVDATGAVTVTSTQAGALSVGANGATNPVIQVDASAATIKTGLKITGAAAAGGLAVAVISSGANEALKVDGKGSGNIVFQSIGTGNIGINQASPTRKVEIDSELSGGDDLQLTHYSTDAQGPFGLRFRKAKGTKALPTAVQAEDMIGSISYRGYGATGFPTNAVGRIAGHAEENYTDAAMGFSLRFLATPTSSITTQEVARIYVASDGGKLQARNADVEVLRANDTPQPPGLVFHFARTSVASPSAVQANDMLGSIAFRGHDGTSYTTQAAVRGYATEIWSGAAKGTYLVLSTTPAGSVTNTERLRVLAAGGVTIATPTSGVALTVSGGGASITGTVTLTGQLSLPALGDTTTNITCAGGSDGQFRIWNTGTGPLSLGATGSTGGWEFWNGTKSSISVTKAGNIGVKGGDNEQAFNLKTLTELLTIDAAASSATTMQIPINAVVFAVSVRVTTVIPTAATFTVTGTSSGTTFNTTAVGTAANTTDVGTAACPYKNGAAQTVTITPNAQPGANTGRVRVTIHYYDITPATT